MKRNPAKNFDCNRGIYVLHKFLMQENDVTPSNVMEMNTVFEGQLMLNPFMFWFDNGMLVYNAKHLDLAVI